MRRAGGGESLRLGGIQDFFEILEKGRTNHQKRLFRLVLGMLEVRERPLGGIEGGKIQVRPFRRGKIRQGEGNGLLRVGEGTHGGILNP